MTMEPGDGRLQIRWSHVSIAAIAVAISALGALVVVAAVKSADVLSTVALALAILAFVIQIVVFIAQAAASADQRREAAAINSETKTILAELRAHSLDTNQTVGAQFDKLLDRVLLNVKGTTPVSDESGSATEEPPSIREQVLNQVAEAVAEVRQDALAANQPQQSVARPSQRRPVTTSGQQERLLFALRGPTNAQYEESENDVNLRNLSQPAAALLAKFANDVVTSVPRGYPEGFAVSLDDEAAKELLEKGFIRRDDEPIRQTSPGEEQEYFATLTDAGRVGASLITAAAVGRRARETFPWLSDARRAAKTLNA